MDIIIAILLIVGGLLSLLFIVGFINYLRNPSDTSHIQPPKSKPTQAERDAYYIQQYGMTEADYMASVDMYANWDE